MKNTYPWYAWLILFAACGFVGSMWALAWHERLPALGWTVAGVVWGVPVGYGIFRAVARSRGR